jgi:hypothetical protein
MKDAEYSVNQGFLDEFAMKTIVQNEQFNQWLKYFFYLNNELSEQHNIFYQELFYVRLHGFFTECFEYADKKLSKLKEYSNNVKLETFYSILVSGITNLKSSLSEDELTYIEYKRNSVCHIFQNGYEIIQDNLTIKKQRNGLDIETLRSKLQNFILLHGNESNIDKYLNNKIQPKLTSIYNDLVAHFKAT